VGRIEWLSKLERDEQQKHLGSVPPGSPWEGSTPKGTPKVGFCWMPEEPYLASGIL